MKKLLRSFAFAFKGLIYAFTTQLNFKIHISLMVFVIIMGWYYQLSSQEWLWLITVISVVLIAELINTSIEVLTDLVSPGYHVKAGIVKDLSAASVLLASLLAIITGLIIFIPKIL